MAGTILRVVHDVSKTGIPASPFETPPALSPLRGWKYGVGSAGPGVHTPGYLPVPLRGTRSRRMFLWNKTQINSWRRQTPVLRRPGSLSCRLQPTACCRDRSFLLVQMSAN
jgi:hypothetical protein